MSILETLHTEGRQLLEKRTEIGYNEFLAGYKGEPVDVETASRNESGAYGVFLTTVISGGGFIREKYSIDFDLSDGSDPHLQIQLSLGKTGRLIRCQNVPVSPDYVDDVERILSSDNLLVEYTFSPNSPSELLAITAGSKRLDLAGAGERSSDVADNGSISIYKANQLLGLRSRTLYKAVERGKLNLQDDGDGDSLLVADLRHYIRHSGFSSLVKDRAREFLGDSDEYDEGLVFNPEQSYCRIDLASLISDAENFENGKYEAIYKCNWTQSRLNI